MTAVSDGSFSIGSQVWPGISKLIEEGGELQQVLGKLIATHGLPAHWDGTHLVDRMIEEMGDVLAAIEEMHSRAVGKLALFRLWHATETQEPV